MKHDSADESSIGIDDAEDGWKETVMRKKASLRE
jgi:hypothetical protein